MSLNSLTKGVLASTILVSGLGLAGISQADASESVSKTYSLKGKVALDLNNNGKVDAQDKVFKGLKIKIYNKDNKVVKTLTSGSNGAYGVKGLKSGVYYVTVDAKVNGVDSSISNRVELKGGKTVDLLFENFNVITGNVYLDVNKNKQWNQYKESNDSIKIYEPGISGVSVQLLGENGKVIETVKSKDTDGFFKFKHFNNFKGKTVRVVAPKGYKLSTPKDIKINTNDVEIKEFWFGLKK